MIFSFWTQASGRNAPPPSESAEEWRAVFPEFCVFEDSSVIEILNGMSKEYADMYQRISLPACKSDVARLVLIYRYGGMYIDIHSHPGNINALAYIFSLLSEYEIVLCDQVSDRKDSDDMSIANGALWCRKNSSAIEVVLHRVLGNLLNHMKKEDDAGEHVPYNISALSGSWAILETLYDTSRHRPLPLRAEAEGKVYRYPYQKDDASSPFHFYRYYNYREPGQHWSELQKTQRLFSEKRATNNSDLTTWRHHLGLTLSEAASRLGCSKGALEQWEQEPSPPYYIALACAAIEADLKPIGVARLETRKSPARRLPAGLKGLLGKR